METQVFESYLRQVRELVLQQHEDSQAENDEIIRLIEELQAASAGNSSDKAFLQGERNFYDGQYEQSLKHYLEAKEIPSFQFFCYRATSLISQERGEFEKALSYAQKALRLDPQDLIMQRLLASLQADGFSSETCLEGSREVVLAAEGSKPRSELFAHECSLGGGQPREHREEHGYALQADEMSDAIQNYILGDSNRSSSAPELGASHNQNMMEGLHRFTLGLGKNESLASTMAGEVHCSHALEQRIHLFQNAQAESMQAYLQQSERRTKPVENMLYILNGWNFSAANKPILFTEESRKSSGGHYLRWNGRGIAINPGPGFLDNFHSQGLCIRDIDFVIVTRNSNEAYADVKAISELNQQLNKTSPDRQMIHYYLHQRVCQELAPFLKPSFKQARNTIHKLEMFLDSPDVEKIELEEGMVLHYFLTTMPGSLQNYRENADEHTFSKSNLGVRLELTSDTRKLKIGYLSGLAWSPLLAHHLGHCDLMLAAFGNTNSSDYSKLGYNEDSLGYYGTSTLLEELAPKLMLLTEFGGREGDIRIEVVKKMRSEYSKSSSQLASALLAADIGMAIDLNRLNVNCSISEVSVAPDEVSVVASSESFGRLRYLSSRYCA